MTKIQDRLNERKAPFIDHIYAKVAIDNTSAVGNPHGSGLSTLRHHIIEAAQDQSYWEEKRPIKWLLLADELDREKEKRQHMTLTEVKTLGKEFGFIQQEQTEVEALGEQSSKNKPDEIEAFLEFHHNLGDLIYFAERGLENTVILSPQWLCNLFRYSLIECLMMLKEIKS